MTQICSVTDALLEYHLRWHGQRLLRRTWHRRAESTWKVPPFYFVPEGTSVPDVEEIQDSKGEFYKYTNIKISHQSRFSRKLVPCSSGLGVI